MQSEALVPRSGGPRTATWLAHPLIVSVLTPIVLAIIFGAGAVWMTQADSLRRLNNVESGVEAEKREREKQVSEIKSQIVPRTEHEARWKAEDDKLDAIQRQGATTNQRVDDIYKLLTQHDRK